MELDIIAWLNLALRWLHLITGICWIGASFYFIWLDNNLRSADNAPKGVSGELWAVHGGGFYHNQKYLVAPDQLPEHLHWFKWEAYFTWISGFLLLGLIYYLGADLYLIDKSRTAFSQSEAIAVSLAFLIVGWIIYDLLCKSPVGKHNLAFGAIWFFLLVAAAYVLTLLFSDRGAFIHVGAIIGTVMVANVFMVIIPNQKKTVAAMIAGETPDPALGKAAKQRSLHNNYMTLPVLFIMVSNHYPMTSGASYNWLVLAGIALSGVAIRHHFNLRHAGRIEYRWVALGAAFFVATMLFTSIVRHQEQIAIASTSSSFDEVRVIINQRCTTCHASQPTHPLFTEAPNGFTLDNDEEIKAQAKLIYDQAVASDLMPLANETEMTMEERQKLGAWILQNTD